MKEITDPVIIAFANTVEYLRLQGNQLASTAVLDALKDYIKATFKSRRRDGEWNYPEIRLLAAIMAAGVRQALGETVPNVTLMKKMEMDRLIRETGDKINIIKFHNQTQTGN